MWRRAARRWRRHASPAPPFVSDYVRADGRDLTFLTIALGLLVLLCLWLRNHRKKTMSRMKPGVRISCASFEACTACFERSSPIQLFLPAFRVAEGSFLSYRRALTGQQCSVLDFNQNAGCAIFGHYPAAALNALNTVIETRPPLRAPLTCNRYEELLRLQLIHLAADALGGDSPEKYECALGLRSGAEAIDLALTLALMAPRQGFSSLAKKYVSPKVSCAPLSIIVMEGSFHGNATRLAFSASAVFRRHSHAAALCELEAIYVKASACSKSISAAFERHDAGAVRCVAVLLEATQHFGELRAVAVPTARALCTEARSRGIAVIADEIWSGVFRTGRFTAFEQLSRDDFATATVAGVAPDSTSTIPSHDYIASSDNAVEPITASDLTPDTSPQAAITVPAIPRHLPSSTDSTLRDVNHSTPNISIWADILVMGKGLSAGLCKQSAIIYHRSLLRSWPAPCNMSEADVLTAATKAVATEARAAAHVAALAPAGSLACSRSIGDVQADGRTGTVESNRTVVQAFVIEARPVEPCALCCSVAHGCLSAVGQSDIVKRAEQIRCLVAECTLNTGEWLVSGLRAPWALAMPLHALLTPAHMSISFPHLMAAFLHPFLPE